jgi:hypothetical protein
LVDLCKEKKKDFEKNNCFSEVKEGIDFLTKLVEVQKNMKEELKKSIPQWCVILDDLISESLLYDKQFI